MKSNAEAQLIENMNYIDRIVNQIIKKNGGFNKQFDIEDMYQEAYIAFLEACDKYDESKGAELITFAAKLIRNRLCDLLRKKNVTKSYKTESVEYLTEVGCQYYENEMNELFEKAEYDILFTQIDEYLEHVYQSTDNKTFHYGILAIRYEMHAIRNNETYKASDLAKKLGTNARYLSVCKQRVRDKYLKNFFK